MVKKMGVIYVGIGKFIVGAFASFLITGVFGVTVNAIFDNKEIDYIPFFVGGIIYAGICNVFNITW